MSEGEYKYNVPPVMKAEYFGEPFWLMLKNAEDIKGDYDWRGGEIVVCTHPRSGTHMVWNLVRYLLQGNTTKPPDAMSENLFPPYLRLEGSPQKGPRRVLGSHVLPCQLSNSLIKTGNRRFIYLIRNPNDCAVSAYNVWNAMIGAVLVPQTFPEFYNEFITGTNKSFPGTGWYNHVKAWEEYVARNPDDPILFLMYENIVRKPKESMAKLAKFLDIEVSEELLDEVAEASAFANMRTMKVDANTEAAMHGDANAAIYRKGVIGNWKNWLTVQNYELFQKVFPELSADMACKDDLIFT